MNRMLDRMRALSIKELKSRREEIFERTRRIMQSETYDESGLDEEDSCMPADPHPLPPYEPILDEKEEKANRKQQKLKNTQYKVQRYYRKMLQVSDWMIVVPEHLEEFYIAPRPDGTKCLVVFEDNSMAIRDKSGRQVFESSVGSKVYNGTLVEGYYNESTQCLVISDLIVWKTNPMTSSEFEFRQAWLCSNLNLKKLSSTQLNLHFMPYSPVTLQNLGKSYQQPCPYTKQGLLFVHKDSFYLHGLNQNVLIWKDQSISKYFQQEIEDNKQNSKGIAFLNKLGQVKTLENVVLFQVDRLQMDPTHRFLKFSYSSIQIENVSQEQVTVKLETPQIIETTRYHNGPIDSLSKLLYKSSIRSGIVTIQQLAERCQNPPPQTSMKQQ